MRLFKKHFFLPLALLVLCMIASALFFYSTDGKHLESFADELAYDLLENNPLELHYSIAYPEKMGLEQIPTNLTPFQTNFYQNGISVWEARVQKLAHIKSTWLNEEQLFLYHLLDNYIQLQLESLQFPYYENPFACSGGVHSQLPILLSEYAFRNKQDIENYFLLLSQVPAYLDGLFTYAYTQELNGICIYKKSLDEVASQCLELFPSSQLKKETHFLQTGFVDRLQSLVEQGIISSKEQSDYAKRNSLFLQNQIAPAYEKLAQNLSTLKGSNTLAGLSQYPKGKEYYTLLLKANTGSMRSVKEIQKMLYDRYDKVYQSYKALLQKNTHIQNFQFPITSHKEMVQHLHTRSQEFFPALSTINPDCKQKVQLKNVHGVLADMSAPAFYMTPPLDANDEHTIYINPSANMKQLDLYTTLAHEGFPGHLYQTVYSQTALENREAPLLRHLLYYGGFTEGWAVYAELYAYQFAISASDEKALDTLLLTRYNRELQLCICSILDIYVHYEGATLTQVEKLLSTLGLNTTNVETIYEVICDAPANYPKYYVGYLEILSLREKAKELWTDNYSDYSFHKWLLETGGGDYKSLEELLLK